MGVENTRPDVEDGEILFDVAAIEKIFYNDMWELLIHLAAETNGLPLKTKSVVLKRITKSTMEKITKILENKEQIRLQECLDILRQNI